MKSLQPHFESLERRLALAAPGSAPWLSGPLQVTVVEDKATPISIRVVDRDSGTLSVKVEAWRGYLAVKPAPGVTVQAPQNRIVVIDGPQAGVAQTLRSLVFKPLTDSTLPTTLVVSASDGIHTASRTTRIRITPVNDAPSLNVPLRMFATQGAVDLGSQPIVDIDSARLTVSIKSDNGVVRVRHPAASNLGGEVRIAGTMEAINGILGTPGRIVLEPAAARNTRLTITADDGRLKATRVLTVSVQQNLRQIATEAVDARIRGRDPAIAKNIFSVMDHDAATYVRNTGAWTHGLDLTCISPWNSAGGDQLAGTLVSPRHIVYATHFQMPVGATVRFVTADNVVVERTLVGKSSLPTVGESMFPDVTVGVLDSDVPPTIGFATILPSDWARYFADGRLDVPCIALDQEEKALVTSLWWLNEQASCNSPSDATQAAFFEDIVRGDSGNPAFMIVRGRAVLLTVWSFGGGGLGTFVTAQKAAINRMMADLGGGYQLTEIDLGGLGTLEHGAAP